MLLVLFVPSIQAAESPEEIQLQQDDQKLCVQQRVKQCIDTCDKTEDTNCSQMCEENAKNECRQAGE